MNKQSGSAHVVIIVVLVIAIIGALGFVFWQNFLQPNTEPAEQNTSQQNATGQQLSIDASFPVRLTADVPADWNVERTFTAPESRQWPYVWFGSLHTNLCR